MQEKEIREDKEKVQQAYYKLRKWPYEVLGLNQFKKKKKIHTYMLNSKSLNLKPDLEYYIAATLKNYHSNQQISQNTDGNFLYSE